MVMITPDVDVVGIQPVEDHRKPFPEVDHPDRTLILCRHVIHDHLIDRVGKLIQLAEIRHGHLVAGNLCRVPAVEPLNVPQIGQSDRLIQLTEMRIVDPRDTEPVARTRLLNKQHLQRIAHRDLQQIGQRTGDQNILVPLAPDVRNRSLNQILLEKGPVVGAVHPP